MFVALYGVCLLRCGVFFFKQKTAYEMRISDWSSDVCSSDLVGEHGLFPKEIEQCTRNDDLTGFQQTVFDVDLGAFPPMRSLLNDAEYREPAELGEGHQRAIGPDNNEGHGSSQEPVNVVREVGDRRIRDHIED